MPEGEEDPLCSTQTQLHPRSLAQESHFRLPYPKKPATFRMQADRQRLKAKCLREEKTPELASGVHNRAPEVALLEQEDDEGNVEYKLRLKQPNHVRFQQLVST